ncbi:MAG TPA: hypothetical protein VKA84_15015 [Gemmatimonadaceae bacterium]|nr:hypothetical protein [Gemmatimonadaceae bacterium]
MALPLILSGPILRRVEPNLVAVQVALNQACTVKLSLWENQLKASDAKDTNLWFRTPDPGAKSIRIGDQLHVCVVTVRLPEAKKLVPERLYSYDLELAPTGQTTKQNFKSLGLLANDPVNADPDGDNTKRLALGYEPDLLPCLLLPPNELTALRLVHGSCRDTDTAFPDGMAWLDDLLSGAQAYKSALTRPHQLFLTGDQIYADEVPAPLIVMLNDVGRTVVGKEQLPIVSKPDLTKTTPIEADLLHFPPRRRHNVVINEGGMTTKDGASHLLSFAEFCAMYLFVWNNEVWPEFPPFETTKPDGTTVRTFDLPADWDTQVGTLLRNAIKLRQSGAPAEVSDYTRDKYDRDIARLTEVRRTLPKVRRALANIPTYMMFDDHEITDDWFLNPTWRDRVLASPFGSAIVRNGMLAYGLFQGWGNDPVKFEPVTSATEKQPHEKMLEQATKFMPAGATAAPAADAARQVEILLGLDLRNEVSLDGTHKETNPPLKWHYTVPGTKHDVLVLDCRTRRSFVNRVSPPGNIGLTAMAEQIPETPPGTKKDVYVVVASLPVIGPPIFDELFAPLLFRVFDFKKEGSLQEDRGTKRMPGTDPDAEEAWCFDPKLFEALLKRLLPYSPVVFLSGDVHYSASNAMSYWKGDAAEPARFVQFISSGFKNIMPDAIRFVSRTFALAQKMARAGVGAERLGWDKSADVLTIPAGANISPRLTGALRKSPVLIPTTGWRGATVKVKSDWAWRVAPLRDTRAETDRPSMTRADTLFPDDPTRTNSDIGAALNFEQYHRTAGRHARQFEKLRNTRQVLFASSLGLVTFQKRAEKANDNATSIGDVVYAVHDLYSAVADPADLTTRPKPLVYSRHEAALRDAWQARPDIQPPKRV